jgi:arylsulfatase A-like enzyme
MVNTEFKSTRMKRRQDLSKSSSGHGLVILLLILTLVHLLSLFSCSKEPAGTVYPLPDNVRAKNLIIVLIDALRADHVGALGYKRGTTPNVDRLVERGALFTAAIAQCPWTRPSVGTLFTGLYPSTLRMTCHNFRNPKAECDLLPSSALTLAEILKGEGFETAGVVANINVDEIFGFAQGFNYFESIPATWAAKDPDWRVHNEWMSKTTVTLTDAALDWLKQRSEERSFFLYLHYLDPHEPYDPPEAHAARFSEESYDVPHPMIRQLEPRYDGEIYLVDEQLERILQYMDEELMLDDTALVILSDHGEEFGDHGGLYHGYTVFDEQIRVPLFMMIQGLTKPAERITDQVRLLDVLPTLLHVLGIEVPSSVQGVSLVPLMAGEETEQLPALSEWGYNPYSSYRLPPWKIVYVHSTKQTMLFNIEEDPGELNDLSSMHPGRAKKMLRALERLQISAFEAGEGMASEEGEIEMPPEKVDQLRSLGYVD